MTGGYTRQNKHIDTPGCKCHSCKMKRVILKTANKYNQKNKNKQKDDQTNKQTDRHTNI